MSCASPQKSAESSEKSTLIQPEKWWEVLPRPIYASLKRIETDQDWYEVYLLCPDTYALYEPLQFEEAISYLVIGEQEAVLIDTGTGIGNLKETAHELTSLPLWVLNTHAHWDHIGCNSQFEKIACFNHPDCIAKLGRGVDKAKLLNAISGNSIWKSLPKGFDKNAWEIPPLTPAHLLEDGEIIDLGNRSLEVIHTPGHSPGSICLLDQKNKILFTGDTFFPGPLYAYEDDVNIDDYIASLDKIITRLPEYEHLLSGHNDPWVKSEVIPRVKEAFLLIKAGKGKYREDSGIRRYFFEGFDILIDPEKLLPEN